MKKKRKLYTGINDQNYIYWHKCSKFIKLPGAVLAHHHYVRAPVGANNMYSCFVYIVQRGT